MQRQESLNFVFVSTFVLLVVCGPALAVDVNGLVAHWAFDEGSGTIAYDSAGGNVGTIYGDGEWGVGQVGGALQFDGEGDYVDCGNTFAGVVASPSKTIMGWAKSDTTSYPSQTLAGAGRILTLYRESGSSGFTIYAQGDPATWRGLYRKAGNVAQDIDSGVSVVVNEWAHVALVQDGADVDVYINGVSENSASDGAAPTTRRHVNADIGAYDAETAMKCFFEGSIDEVRIYDRALSAVEVEELYWTDIGGAGLAIFEIELALAENEAALEGIDIALEKELAAYEALEEALESKDYGDLGKSDIIKARQRIHSAIQHQDQSAGALERGLEQLIDALEALGAEPEPNEPYAAADAPTLTTGSKK
ncbi:MAG: hypothetical protein JSW23_05180 [Planctomycetota bacterium]|nr:MAG: hypothetical protein JSW23_05180 [Planctomycetota bacterium]